MTQTLHRRLLDCAAGLSDDPVTFAQLARMHGPARQGTLLVPVATPARCRSQASATCWAWVWWVTPLNAWFQLLTR